MAKETERESLLAVSHRLQNEPDRFALPWWELYQQGLRETWMAFDRLARGAELKNGVCR